MADNELGTRIDPSDGNAYVGKELAIYDGAGSPTGKRRNVVVTDILGGHEGMVPLDDWLKWEEV